MFYITTAIDYTNGNPHIGHAYEKVLADVIARYQKLQGREVFYLTGVDQHGQKVQQTAQKEGVSPATFAKRTTKKFLSLWENLGIEYNGWAETTDSRHIRCVQSILSQLYDNGEIYKKQYKGYYSVRQEQFLTDKERNEDGVFGEEWGEVEERDEENYYFSLSAHAQWLADYIESTPDAILPHFRRNEVLNAVKRAAETDLCISRPKERLHWGIELPFDKDFVTYVWFDALINYISFAGYQKAKEDSSLPSFDALWPANIHLIGKDILVPSHSIYWPCMLHALGLQKEDMPTLLVHGWWNIKGEKMSKSLGNVIDPESLFQQFGSQALRFYLVADIVTGKDSDFSIERLLSLYNSQLANDLGNLCNRSLSMAKRFLDSTLVPTDYDDDDCAALRHTFRDAKAHYINAMESFNPSEALQAIHTLSSFCNGFAERQKPWELAKSPEKKAQLCAVLTHMIESCAHISVWLSPITPEACLKLQNQLGISALLEGKTLDKLSWGLLPKNHTINKPKPIFARLQLEE